MKLGEAAYSHDNNFNLIRFLAAYTVLFSHSYVLATGNGGLEPFARLIGYPMAGIAIDVFFVVSGFLVTGSLFRRSELWKFIKARILRIYPALLVNNLLVVFVLGTLFTTYSVREYFSDPQPWNYLLRNSTLLFKQLQYYLPGVFIDLPYPGAVNGSLWTLTYELACYTGLAFMWAFCVLLLKSNRRVMGALLVILALTALFLHFYSHLGFIKTKASYRLGFFFLCGSSMFMLRDYIALKHQYALIATALVLFAFFYPKYFHFIYTPLLGYLTLYCAYVPSGKIRLYNNVGDYSYGTYIYSFVVQQALVYLYPKISVTEMNIYATLITLACAMLSWHFIEKRALSYK